MTAGARFAKWGPVWKLEDAMGHDPAIDRRSLMRAGATLAAASTLGAGASSVARAQISSLNPQPLPPSPEWARSLPPGPDARVKITEAYAAHVARDAFFWAWPLVNVLTAGLRSRR
jgi:hypothetical protein